MSVATEPKIPLVVTLRWLMAEGVVGSRRMLYRQIGEGKFPIPNCKVGKRVAWTRSLIRSHMEKNNMLCA